MNGYNKDYQKGAVLALLILACAGLTYYSHWVIHTDVAFYHFFYFPVVLAGFWWAKRGAWAAVFLGVLLIASGRLSGLDVPVAENALRCMMLVAVGLTMGFGRDMSLRSQRNLQETRDYLDSLIRHANAPIMVWDKEGKITLFNAAFELLTGYQSNEIIGKRPEILFSEASKEQSLQKIKQTSEGERWEAVEIPIRCKDGKERILLCNSANIYAPDGKTLISTIAQGQDITMRKQAEQALRLRMKGLKNHERITESMLDQRMKELGAYERITASMLYTLDLDERLKTGLTEIMSLTGAEKAGISLAEADRLVVQKQFGFSEDFLAWAGDLA